MSGAERREHERFELLASVDLHRGVNVDALTVINISAGGVLLRNDDNVEFEVGEDIRLHFDAPALGVAFTMNAKVIRVIGATAKRAALAAMWTSSDASAAAALGQLLWSLKDS